MFNRMDHSNSTRASNGKKVDVTSPRNITPMDVLETSEVMTSPIGSLALGFDTKEDWDEELRDAPVEPDSELPSPIIVQKKPLGKFMLTPRLSGHETSQVESSKPEVSDQMLDLTTPHQSLIPSSDCPGRPAKGRRGSVTPATERSSCRYLFSQEISLSAPSVSSFTTENKDEIYSQEQDHKHGMNLKTLVSESSECDSSKSLKSDNKEGNVEVKDDTPCFNEEVDPTQKIRYPRTSHVKLNAFKSEEVSIPKIEDLPTPVGSPCSESSASSHCSDCTECSSSSGSSLSSPILSQVKLMSQTIESSPIEEDCDKEIVEAVVDLPKMISSPDGCKHDPEDELKLGLVPQISLESREINTTEGLDIKAYTEGLSPVLAKIPISAKEAYTNFSEVSSSTRNGISPSNENKIVKPEVNLTISSVGSSSSNWTAISGISPLPASDPSHHHKHRHHHHHHHRHHTRHHHYGGHCHSYPRIGDILVTSTPIHKKIVVENLDVSAVTSNAGGDCSPMLYSKESRFILSSELQFADSPAPLHGAVYEAEVLGSQESCQKIESAHPTRDRGRTEPGSALSPQENPRAEEYNVEVKKNTSNKVTTGNSVDTGHSRKRLCSSSRSNLEKNKTGDEEDDELAQKKSHSGTNCLQMAVPSPKKLSSWLRNKEVEDAWTRPITKKEAKVLLATPVNFMDNIWEQMPSPRRASSVDESLFRGVSLDSHLSVTLE